MDGAFEVRPATNADAQAVRGLVFAALREHGLAPDPAGTDADLDDVESCYARAGGPFDASWRHTDLRRLASTQTPGRGSPVSIQLWAWRLRPYGVQQGEALVHCSDDVYRRFTFDPFGLDTPLFTLPQPLPQPTQPAGSIQTDSAAVRQ